MPLVTQVTTCVRPTPGWYWYRENNQEAAPIQIGEGKQGELQVFIPGRKEFRTIDQLTGELGDEILPAKKFIKLGERTETKTSSNGNGERATRRIFNPAKDQKIDEEKLAKFFYWIKERHYAQLLRMAGNPKPWTKDPILQNNFFCNVFRELDKNTVWFREHIRDPLKKSPSVVLATIIFRWFNHIPTAISLLTGSNMETTWNLEDPVAKDPQRILKGSLFTNWDSSKALKLLKDHKQVFTGAHVVASGLGAMKLDSILTCIDQVAAKLDVPTMEGLHMQECHEYLRGFPAIGNFLAYEIVCDLRFTEILNDAHDINSWANAGPGAMRGLDRLYNRPLHFQRESYNWVAELVDLHRRCENEMKKAHQGARGSLQVLNTPIAPRFGAKPYVPAFELREVESCLCEFDKYMRVAYPLEGEYEPGSNPKQSKRKYNGSA